MTFQKISKYLLIILGLAMFSSFIWLRFLRTRLPRDVPFNLSTLGFIVLVYICCIYAYVVFSYVRESYTPKPLISYLVDCLYRPLKNFDSFIKSPKFIEVPYLRLMTYLSYKLMYFFKDTSIFYFIFGIFPRLVLITALFIDIFWFHKLFYIYKILLIGVLLFLRRYIMYCFKHVKELLTLQQEVNITGVSTTYVHSIHMEFYGHYYDPTHPEYDEETAEGESSQTMFISLRRFIELQTDNIVYENRLFTYTIMNTRKFWNDIHTKYNIKPEDNIPYKISSVVYKQEDFEVDNIVQISVLLEYYNISNNTDEKYNNIYKLIFSTYFLSWFYILIMSSNTLPIESYVYILDVIVYILFILILLGNYLFLLYLYKVDQIITNDKKSEEDKLKTFLERRFLAIS